MAACPATQRPEHISQTDQAAQRVPSILTCHVVLLGIDVHLIAVLVVVQALHTVHRGQHVHTCVYMEAGNNM